MGRIKLPRSLLRALFPRRSKKSGGGKGGGFVPVVDVDGTGGVVTADPAPATTRASTSYLDLEELLFREEHGAGGGGGGESDLPPPSSSPPVAVDALVVVASPSSPTRDDDATEVENPGNVMGDDDGASAIPAGVTALSSEYEGHDDANGEANARSGENHDDDDDDAQDPGGRICPEHEQRPDLDSPSSTWDRRPTASDILAAIATVEDAPEDDDDNDNHNNHIDDGGGGRESVDDVRGVATGTHSEEGGDRYHYRADRNDEDAAVVQRIAVDGDCIIVTPPQRPRPSPTVVVVDDGFAGAAARSSFSHRGEEARSRAIARQRRILSRAGDRLDAISKTSLASIEEAGAAEIAVMAEATESPSVATTSEYGSVRSSVTHSRRIVDDDGEEMGGISSIVFYESPTMMRNTPPTGQGGAVASMEGAVQAQEWGGAAVVTPTADEGGKVRRRSFDDDVIVGVPASGEKEDSDRNSDSILDMQFFVLMLCPTSRIFELVDIASYSTDEDGCAAIISPQSTVDDVLKAITRRCTDDRLLTKKYVGFIRACDRTEFVDLKKKAFVQHRPSSSSYSTNFKYEGEHGHGKLEAMEFIRENDVLVAVLEGYSGHQMAKISKPILRNSKFREMVRRRSRKVNDYSPNRTGVSDAGGSSQCHENADRGRSDGDDNMSTRSSGNNSARSSQSRRRRPYASKQGGGGSKRVVTVDDLIGSRRDDDGLLIDSEISVGRSWSKRRKNKVSSSKKAAAYAAASKGAPSSPKTNDIRNSSLCQKLELLSKKLHDVDDEIVHDDPISSSAIATDRHYDVGEEHSEDVVFNKSATTPQYDVSVCNTNFKMTPKMVAYELAMNIEEIFADHNVEIVAVDADDEGSDSDVDNDDDTFFSSRSMRSNALSARALGRNFDNAFVSDGGNKDEVQGRPVVLEFIAQKKDRKIRKFDIYGEREENDLMMQIEAMARQADAAFESRKNTVAGALATAIIEPRMGIAETIIDGNRGPGTMEDTDEEAIGIIANNIAQDCLETSFDEEIDIPTPNDGLSITESINKKGGRGSMSKKQSNAISRKFLNASTSMVSTMVATSQGRVNEVHVLQYLGVTIVCIAANFMEQSRGRGADTASPSSTAKAVFQSAMFLAFVANGQRYLAKVTKKS